MSRPQRSRRLARLAGCAALTLGLAGAAAGTAPAALARARGILPTVNRHAVLSWGGNFNGDLGNGMTADSSAPGPVSGFGTGVVQVAAGFEHSLAVRSDGTVWAWGSNYYGELGDGTTTASSKPVQVTGLTGVIAVAAGTWESLALRSDGTVWAWGRNQYGQLGNGTTTDSSTPVRVTGLTGVTKIASTYGFSMALRSDGTVWVWGDGGRFGTGRTTSSPVPVKVAGLSQVTGIAANQDSAYAIRTSSITDLTSVWAWGRNTYGDLGDGSTAMRLAPEQVTGINAPRIACITASQFFVVVLGTDGSVWGWGQDGVGELGNTPTTQVLRPQEVILPPGLGITQLSAGDHHVLALKSDGTALAWGDNTNGELGDGTTASVTGPVQVTGLTGATQVAAGGAFSLAVYLPPQHA
jgi:alpha-tubulin suppressor-like RCC1 family protein